MTSSCSWEKCPTLLTHKTASSTTAPSRPITPLACRTTHRPPCRRAFRSHLREKVCQSKAEGSYDLETFFKCWNCNKRTFLPKMPTAGNFIWRDVLGFSPRFNAGQGTQFSPASFILKQTFLYIVPWNVCLFIYLF